MFISLDLETTGIDPIKDKIIEFGAIKFDLEGHREELSFLINPGVTLPQIITHITHIKDEDLKNKPFITEKMTEIENFIGDLPIIGHNIQFDVGFLQNIGMNLQNPTYDTFELANILLPNLPSYSLEILSNVIGLEHKEKHRALDDAIAAMDLFTKLAKKFQELPEDIFNEIKEVLKRSSWGLKDFLLPLPHIKSTATPSHTDVIHDSVQNLTPIDISPIISQETSSLIEFIPPYKELILKLTKEAKPNSFISIPHGLFLELSKEISDDLAKLDSTEKYISLKRLEEFSKKESFENHEVTTLMKYLIWSKQTSTGLLKEVSLFNREKTVTRKFNCDSDIIDPSTEPFIQKALEKKPYSPSICSHDYIIENRPHLDHLILIDFDDFSRDIFFQVSNYLKLEICLDPLNSLKELLSSNVIPDSIGNLIDSLINKTTILFGLIGMLYEKYREQNSYFQSLLISDPLFDKKEWTDIGSAINNLIEISKELGEIKNEKTTGYLQKWKKILTGLKEIFQHPDLGNHLTEITQGQNAEVNIRRSPMSISSHMKEILGNCKSYKIVDECLDINDNAEFTKTVFDLDKNIELIKFAQEKEKPEIIIKHDNEFELNYIVKYLKEHREPSIVLFSARQQLEIFTLKLSKILSNENINVISQLTGSPQKIAEKFKMDPENSLVLITVNSWLNFSYPELVKNLFVQKIPFEAPSNPYFIALSRKFQNNFIEFGIPHAQVTIKKIMNRLSQKNSRAIFLDSRISEKDYCKPILDMLTSS